MHIEMYQSHLDHLAAVTMLVRADLDLLKSLKADPAEKQRLLADARDQYTRAARAFRIICLRYYSDPRAFINLLPAGASPAILESLSDQKLEQLNQAVVTASDEMGYDKYEDDLREYLSYRARAMDRLKMLGT